MSDNQMETSGSSVTTSNHGDEFDTPFKIKENIFMSIKNLKPVLLGLDPLRSSTSDDEDSHSENMERKALSSSPEMNISESDSIVDSSSPTDVIVLGSTVAAKSGPQVQQRNVYLRANSVNAAAVMATTASKYNQTKLANLTTTTVISTTSPSVFNRTGKNLKLELIKFIKIIILS